MEIMLDLNNMIEVPVEHSTPAYTDLVEHIKLSRVRRKQHEQIQARWMDISPSRKTSL